MGKAIAGPTALGPGAPPVQVDGTSLTVRITGR